MKNSYENFLKIFERIKKQGFVKSQYYDSGAAGKTFETLLNKKLDNKQLPDYEDIEIKTIMDNSKYPISLFSCSISKSNNNAKDSILYLLDNYGYNIVSNYKALRINVKCDKIKYCKNGFGFMIKVSIRLKRIYLFVFYRGKLIDMSLHWNFDELKYIFENKLKKLICIKYDKIALGGIKYFNYHDFDYFELQSFEKVIDAVKTNLITISFNLNKKNDLLDYHGINFVIYYKDLERIYEKR